MEAPTIHFRPGVADKNGSKGGKLKQGDLDKGQIYVALTTDKIHIDTRYPDTIANSHFIDTDAVTIIGICLSVGVHVTYCIWNEGYFPVKNNRKSFIIMALATAVLYIFFSIEAVKEGKIVVDGVITGNCGNIACAILFTFICIVALIKFAIEKKEDEQ